MLKAIVMAFSFYTRLPMPYIKKPGKSMKYILSWFPMTGVILGMLQILVLWALQYLSLPSLFVAVMVSVFPIIYTGGIHVDGFMDTTDALRSYKSKEDKIKIMDDPHSGAFSIIALAIYLLVCIALYYLIAVRMIAFNAADSAAIMILMGTIFVMSRSLSSLTCYILPKAKNSGMLYDITDGAWSDDVAKKDGEKETVQTAGMNKDAKCNKRLMGSCIIPALFLCTCAAIQIYAIPVAGIVNLTFQALLYIYYRSMCVKQFGGLTGDTAGWYLCKSEAAGLFSIALYLVLNTTITI